MVLEKKRINFRVSCNGLLATIIIVKKKTLRFSSLIDIIEEPFCKK